MHPQTAHQTMSARRSTKSAAWSIAEFWVRHATMLQDRNCSAIIVWMMQVSHLHKQFCDQVEIRYCLADPKHKIVTPACGRLEPRHKRPKQTVPDSASIAELQCQLLHTAIPVLAAHLVFLT